MTSTSVTTVGGVVIVTQVIPKDDLSIPLESPANPAVQAVQPVVKPPPAPSKEDTKESIFLRGEPLGLGVVQIFIGTLCLLVSLLVLFSRALMIYAPFALCVLFVLSGSLALAAGRRTSVRLVWVSLVSNGFSVLLSLAAGSYTCFLLAAGPPTRLICNYQTSSVDFQTWNITSRTVDNWERKCPSQLWRVDTLLYGLQGVILVLLVLQICVSVTVCVLSGKVIRSTKHYSLMVQGESDSCSEKNLRT
ncbi:membrane-spanning 4-domains subfamily A member 4A isoform X1 [Poecilia latipinna]|uniref:membrane-spanning 4-domains subfamily A member 4A isoform X1 n=1 Tax=Poecilia latipinna TaxID=48699 RepID=UPI00072EDFD2|nr:PREDICTED: membrane-spanning 4-domains subfamily A member 4A isoform X1 [Poecilia latipinna]